MSLTTAEQQAITRSAEYNHDQYNAITNPYGMGGVGYKTAGDTGLKGNWSQSVEDTATLANATAREAAAAVAAAGATGTSSTSSTSLTVGTGAKSLTVDTGKSYVAGMEIKVARTSAPTTTYMKGPVTSYNSETGALNFTAESTAGSGTHTDWSISFDPAVEVVDEDDMSSNSETKVPTQQSVKAYVDNKIESIIIAVSDETTDLTTGTAKVTFRMPYAFTVTGVRASVTTAPTDDDLIIDINENASSILSTKLTIDDGEKTSTTAATAAVINDSSLADDAEITIDVDQIGSTIAGAGLKVTLLGYKA